VFVGHAASAYGYKCDMMILVMILVTILVTILAPALMFLGVNAISPRSPSLSRPCATIELNKQPHMPTMANTQSHLATAKELLDFESYTKENCRGRGKVWYLNIAAVMS